MLFFMVWDICVRGVFFQRIAMSLDNVRLKTLVYITNVCQRLGSGCSNNVVLEYIGTITLCAITFDVSLTLMKCNLMFSQTL